MNNAIYPRRLHLARGFAWVLLIFSGFFVNPTFNPEEDVYKLEYIRFVAPVSVLLTLLVASWLRSQKIATCVTVSLGLVGISLLVWQYNLLSQWTVPYGGVLRVIGDDASLTTKGQEHRVEFPSESPLNWIMAFEGIASDIWKRESILSRQIRLIVLQVACLVFTFGGLTFAVQTVYLAIPHSSYQRIIPEALYDKDVDLLPYSGKIRLQFTRRLLSDWNQLATILEIPDHERMRWKQGEEADGIWMYLHNRDRLPTLPNALRDIDREDLARLFEEGKPNELTVKVDSAVEALTKSIGSENRTNTSTNMLQVLLVQEFRKSDELTNIAREIRELIGQLSQERLGESKSHDERIKLRNELPKYSGLEAAVVGASLGTDDFSGQSFIHNYQLAARRICAIGDQSRHVGTGFLVASDLILTNKHVWDEAFKAGKEVYARFDTDSNQTELRIQIDAQPLALSNADHLDYAILQIRSPIVDGRGSFTLCDYRPQFRESIYVLGFPGRNTASGVVVANPLTLRSGVLFDSNSQSKRIAYSAETFPGSSGSPVFRETFQLIALHNHGEAEMNNHGIPIWAILSDLNTSTRNALLVK